LIATDLERDGVPAIALRGSKLEVVVCPDAGGKILDLVHRESGANLLWRNPRVPVRATQPGHPFDDVWCGGWDELFPTDPPCELDGNSYHDHGDLWIGPWEWDIQEDVLYLRRYSASLPCLMERWISLERDALEVRVRYRLSNLGVRPVHYVWNVHVAHALQPGSRVQLPAQIVAAVPPYAGRVEPGEGDVAWSDDLGLLPGPDSGLSEYLVTHDLTEGSCAVTHPTGLGLRLTFDRSVFPNVWLFAAYGGWRGHYFLLTEPSTGAPGSLADNVADGTATELGARESLETEVLATVLTE
jgi:galactose mutarotase-like enzyme